ncbi:MULTISPECIES: Eco57I restriction-modification methylase domain-containing protein [unclassified Nocardioides]|uniref:Eco57I restriction-modification methylase domain-containing protein n=1 Tax=unclassified Nocardioides TaxID=2615069 RepID=UPI00301489BA
MSEAMLLGERKAFGAYYTPTDAAHVLASWAMRHDGEVLLEPSLGDGSFVAAAQEVAAARGWARPGFVAAELNPRTAAGHAHHGLVRADELAVGDFLTTAVRPVDAVVGNPPYVRLRALPDDQARSAVAASRDDLGEPMASSGSVWMPFVTRASRFLRPGGRLALVLPWDFTYVRYARPLWRHLGETFGSLRVVRVRERLFPDIGQDVLLLLADHKGGRTDRVSFEAHRTVADLVADRPEVSTTISVERVVRGERAFQEALLPAGVLDVLEQTRPLTVAARELATFNIGYVSGDKDFFHPPARAGLPEESLRPALTNARRLRGGGLWTSELPADAQSRLWLPGERLSPAEERYERRGRRLGVHRRYKCRVRSPWYAVPGVKVPDLVLSVFSQRPILMINDGGHVATNSLLCGYLRPGVAADAFAAGWYTSLTLLHAELEVHSLGGGVFVLVPTEAGNVRVPVPGTVPETVLPLVAEALGRGDLDGAYRAGDQALAARVGTEGVRLVQDGIAALEAWRTARPVSPSA